MSRSRIHADGRVIALFATLTVAIAACHAGSVAPSTTASALHGVESIAPTLHRSDLAVLIADAGAARGQGDWQNLRRFQAALVDRVGPTAISAARAEYRRALVDLAAADARGDARVRAALRVELLSMCGSDSVVGAFETCDPAALTWAR